MKKEEKEALFCMKLAQIAYHGEYGKNDINKKIHNYKEYRIKNTEFFTCKDSKNDFYIVFQGSNNLKDWIANLKFLSETDSQLDMESLERIGTDFKFHKGHLKQWHDVEDFIFKKLIENGFIQNINKIYFTGHSLGGSLAEIGSCITAKCFPFLKEKLVVRSFGANRNMGWKTKHWFNKNVMDCYRYVNGDDIVPKMPPNLIDRIGLCHPATKRKIGRKEPWWKFLLPIHNIKHDIEDHYPQAYIKSLENEVIK